MKKKRLYKKYLTMNPLYASELFNTGKISYEKYQMAFYSALFKFSRHRVTKEALIEMIYG
jgi:hypothetical protein